jgi:hypothetical protein
MFSPKLGSRKDESLIRMELKLIKSVKAEKVVMKQRNESKIQNSVRVNSLALAYAFYANLRPLFINGGVVT